MGEPWGAGDIADGIDTGFVGLHVAVGDDVAAVEFDFGFFEAEIFGYRRR